MEVFYTYSPGQTPATWNKSAKRKELQKESVPILCGPFEQKWWSQTNVSLGIAGIAALALVINITINVMSKSAVHKCLWTDRPFGNSYDAFSNSEKIF